MVVFCLFDTIFSPTAFTLSTDGQTLKLILEHFIVCGHLRMSPFAGEVRRRSGFVGDYSFIYIEHHGISNFFSIDSQVSTCISLKLHIFSKHLQVINSKSRLGIACATYFAIAPKGFCHTMIISRPKFTDGLICADMLI